MRFALNKAPALAHLYLQCSVPFSFCSYVLATSALSGLKREFPKGQHQVSYVIDVQPVNYASNRQFKSLLIWQSLANAHRPKDQSAFSEGAIYKIISTNN